MSLYDTDKIRADYPVSRAVEAAGIKLTRDGQEFKACCPFHKERTPSFTINDAKGFYHCFACSAHGDVVDFVKAYHSVSFREACAIITGDEPAPEGEREERASKAVDVYAGLTGLPAPQEVWQAGKRTPLIYNPKRADDEKRRFVRYTPSMVFPYRKPSGEIGGYVLRIDLDGGGKITPTIRYAQLPDGTEGWTHWAFKDPRPLYGLDRMAAAPNAQVFVCEGEKAADACARLLGVVAVAWPGGTNAVEKVNWPLLRGRKVVLWPDADPVGWDAMQRVAVALQGIAAEVKIIDSRDHAVKGWDAADAEADGMSKADALAWGKARISIWRPEMAASEGDASTRKDEVASAHALAGNGQPSPNPTPSVEIKATQQEKPEPAPEPKKKPKPRLTVIEAGEPHPDLWRNRLVVKEDGAPKPRSVENGMLTLQYHDAMAGSLVYDAFADMVMFTRRPPWEKEDGKWHPRPIRDDDAIACAGWLERPEAGSLGLKPHEVQACMMRVAKANEVDPAREWLEAQVWDGTERINHWLSDFCEAESTAFVTTVARKFLISAVKRVMEPGCKVDAMLILEGSQGLGKSAALRVLGTWGGRSYFTDQVDDINNKDALIQIQGVAVIEFAEMDTLNKADTDNIKKFITRQVDRYRPPYGRVLVDRPRRCVFAGTVNPGGNGYLKDPTGARRFWPVAVGNIDLDGLAKAVPQLWAEAVAAWRAGERNWIDDPEVMKLASDEQSARYEDDPWAELIDRHLLHVDAITITELMEKLDIPPERRDRRASNRIGAHLRHRGWSNRKDYRPHPRANPQRRFYAPTSNLVDEQGEIEFT